jgi:serine/threonine protein kinase
LFNRYFALERFDATLEQYCNKQYTGPMPFKPNTLWQISSGLNFLHDKGLVHGQLNPSSILIVRSQSVLIKISDSLRKFKLKQNHPPSQWVIRIVL